LPNASALPYQQNARQLMAVITMDMINDIYDPYRNLLDQYLIHIQNNDVKK